MTHHLKTWPRFYENVASGAKTFEIRKDDRDFNAGDVLVLQEYEPDAKAYTGRECAVRVTFVTSLRPLHNAVGMSIERIDGIKAGAEA